MPQIKKKVPVVGIYPALRADAVRFVETWKGWDDCPDVMVSETHLGVLANVAIEPTWVGRGISADAFARWYKSAPDFVLAFMTEMRKCWRRNNSPSARLQAFLALHTCMKPHAHQKEAAQWDLTDGELATAFELSTKEPVSEELVEKARKALAGRIEKGKRLSPWDIAWQGGERLRLTKRTVQIQAESPEALQRYLAAEEKAGRKIVVKPSV